MKILLLTFVLLAFAIVLLGVKALFVKDGRFSSGHVRDSRHLRERGIGCAAHDEDLPGGRR